MVRHAVVFLLNCENISLTIIKQVTVLDAIRWLKTTWDKIDKSTICDCFKKCRYSLVESVTEEAQDDPKFQNLLQRLSTEVTAKEYLSYDDDDDDDDDAVETH